MENILTFNHSGSSVKESEIKNLQPFVNIAHEMIHSKSGVGKEWLGWVKLPISYNKNEFERIKKVAKEIREIADVLVVIGIGGSYLGSRAAIEMLTPPFKEGKRLEIYYVGHHLSSDYIKALLEYIEDKEVCVNVISKSGTTIEPAIAFRLLRHFMHQKYKDQMRNRIFVTTDKEKGVLKRLADEEGYKTFVIPDNIGGRYSVLTAVGLLPIAASGVNIDEVMAGAEKACISYRDSNLLKNNCYIYAVVRNILQRKGKSIELLVNYEPSLTYFAEWWKQLFGESEGKDGKGLFPASVNFTTDLHSLGQYIQDGFHTLFETKIHIETTSSNLVIPKEEKDKDCLNYLAGNTLHDINITAFKGTLKAHIDGGIPVSIISLTEFSPFNFGALVYFFQKACAMSGYLLGVNPFDQPGVEVYKKHMFQLLGKDI